MGLFTPRNKGTYSPTTPLSGEKSGPPSNSKQALNPEIKPDSSISGKTDSTKKDVDKGADNEPEDSDLETVGEKKQYAKEKAPVGATGTINEPETISGPESETLLNTKLNAMLYHTSEDSIDLYRTENNSSDLLGRLYYDDYDPENKQVVERVTSFTSLQTLARGRASPGLAKPTSDPKPESSRSGAKIAARRPSFERQVSFDTLCDTHHSAITLKVKHPDFKFRRNNKTFLIGFSNDSESMKAVEWAFLEMVISGDTIVVLQVLDEKSYTFVDPSLAEIVLEKLKKLNMHGKRISLVYEVVIGNPQKLLKQAILEYKPAMMIVGTRQYGSAPPPESLSPQNSHSHGISPVLSHPQPVRHNGIAPVAPAHHSPLHRSFFSKSSTSKYFLQYALVPVIIVKPFYKIHETLDKPVDSENYFRDWLGNIDVSHTREKKKKHMFGMRSRSSSRNTSQTSLSNFMRHDTSHERTHEKLSERLHENPHESRGRSQGEMFQIHGSGSRDSSRSRSRSRTSPTHEISGGTNLDATLSAGSRSGSRSRSRSRLSRLFSG